MNTKKITAIILASVLCAALFAGCGESNSGGGTATQAPAAQTQAPAEQTEAPAAAAGTDYTFEAEYTDLEGLEGLGVSGSPTGTGLISESSKASNGFYVGNLGTASPITFVITSDASTTATLKGCFGTNVLGSQTWDPKSFVVTVNGTALNYSSFKTEPGSDVSDQQNFSVKNLGEIQLNAGENEIVLVAGDNTYRSNMPSAPSIDYIRITSTAALSMDEITENIE